MSSMLELLDVSLSRGGRPVLDKVNLRIAEGEVLVLLGPSGAGKTSVLRLLLGFLVPDRGKVLVQGRCVAEDGRLLVPPEQRELAVVFQDLALWPHLRVAENLAFMLEARGVPAREQTTRIAESLARVGLEGMQERFPGELSGGEQQRVALARALVSEPHALLLDEPLSNLDAVRREELVQLLQTLLHGARVSTLLVSHDPREAAALGHRLAVLEQGHIVQQGSSDELAAQPATPFVSSLARLGFGKTT